MSIEVTWSRESPDELILECCAGVSNQPCPGGTAWLPVDQATLPAILDRLRAGDPAAAYDLVQDLATKTLAQAGLELVDGHGTSGLLDTSLPPAWTASPDYETHAPPTGRLELLLAAGIRTTEEGDAHRELDDDELRALGALRRLAGSS